MYENNILPEQPAATPKILVVDDDLTCRLAATALLQEHYAVETVTNGHDALEAVEKNRFDAILMDINLNNMAMDGIRTMRMIRFHRKHRNIKILAVTATAGTSDWFLNQGFDGHFKKPFIGKELIDEIRKKLQHPEHLHENMQVA